MSTNDSKKQHVTREQIERRAYEIYLQRGGSDGTDMEDWLIAERELLGEQDGARGIDSGRAPLHTNKPSEKDEDRNVSETRQRRGAGA
jgi:hypothetical protein